MTNSHEWKVKIYENPEKQNFDFYIMSNTPGDIRAYVSDAKNGTIEYLQEGETMSKGPSFTLTKSMMEALFTSLQGQGMKPVEQSFIEGKLQATETHLSDMRTLVFNK